MWFCYSLTRDSRTWEKGGALCLRPWDWWLVRGARRFLHQFVPSLAAACGGGGFFQGANKTGGGRVQGMNSGGVAKCGSLGRRILRRLGDLHWGRWNEWNKTEGRRVWGGGATLLDLHLQLLVSVSGSTLCQNLCLFAMMRM